MLISRIMTALKTAKVFYAMKISMHMQFNFSDSLLYLIFIFTYESLAFANNTPVKLSIVSKQRVFVIVLWLLYHITATEA